MTDIADEPCEYCGGTLVRMTDDIFCCDECGRQVSEEFLD